MTCSSTPSMVPYPRATHTPGHYPIRQANGPSVVGPVPACRDSESAQWAGYSEGYPLVFQNGCGQRKSLFVDKAHKFLKNSIRTTGTLRGPNHRLSQPTLSITLNTRTSLVPATPLAELPPCIRNY